MPTVSATAALPYDDLERATAELLHGLAYQARRAAGPVHAAGGRSVITTDGASRAWCEYAATVARRCRVRD